MHTHTKQSTTFENTQVDRLAARLRERYGHEILRLDEAAAELRRSPGGLRFALSSMRRRHQPWVQRLLLGKRRIGRSVYFDVLSIADVLVHGDQPLAAADDKGAAK